MATFARAQSFTLDCSCLSTQSVLITNACQAVVPDLCQFTNCWTGTLFPPPTLTCSQSPPAGTPVTPGSYGITVTISDSSGAQQSCALTFTVNPVPNTMSLLCAPNKTVECGSTWNFDQPTATNVCCPIAGTPDGAFIFVASTVTNGTCPEIITQTWQAFDGCMNAATCSQQVTVVDTTPPVLNCDCLTNNPLVQIPMTVTNCADFIPDLCHTAFICVFDNCGPPSCSQTPAPNTPVGPGDFTVDAWVKPASLNNTIRVIVDHREENGPVVRGYSLFLGGNNGLAFQIADGAGFINYPSTLTVPADGRWHFVAVTVKRNDAQGIRFYVDGVQQALGRDTIPFPGSVTAGPCYPFRVGSRSSSVSGLFPGCIDEVELFRRALTPAEIKAIYDARCRGKCRMPCQAGDWLALSCWLPANGGNGTTIDTIIFNPLAVPMSYTYTYVPVTGPGCASPPSFSPSTGTVLVPANSYYFPLPQVQVTFPGGLNPGDCACYKLVITSADGSQHIECNRRYCLPRSGPPICTDPFVPVVPLTTSSRLW